MQKYNIFIPLSHSFRPQVRVLPFLSQHGNRGGNDSVNNQSNPLEERKNREIIEIDISWSGKALQAYVYMVYYYQGYQGIRQ